ncbi:hypothetical protein PtrSN002B_008259 [Pyrenophora tritici-repentis]|nr:hypothetical protein PtrV1_12125 [Pyrenophora tritici-repentis]KAF7444916.1 hypothetical protein A1F99_114690 [Pyrenophora tritici-repentis]KAI0573329.1 hypothetical protein Alg215_09259 [Pyrenophora tritici-repentis]KAI0613492.1 hypothetical protein TUN205_02297 [Pyrenophora tritici-repentis]KAI1527668.1 hypothetical protein PtrSN001C_009776 [Pyrenophora tritici-repentis]
MTSPPGTPTDRPASSHRRHPSSLDMTHNTASRRQSFNRRSSGYSPITPRSSQDFDHESTHQFDGGGDGNGLGNLADELGEHDGSYGVESAASINGVRDSGVAMQDSSPAGLSPESAVKTRKHARARSLYDGSDYGDDSDLENEGISPALESRMAAIESLVRRGIEENGSASDEVVKRVTKQLQNLGSQIAIENGATRLKTAHDALATHLTHQSRSLTSLSASFSGPRPILPDPDTIEELLPLIQSTLELLPYPSTEPLVAISHLTHSNRELLQHLANVSDTLHMSRQTTATATRRLKVSTEQLQDWKRESDKTKEGQDYIEHGDWDRRLKEREAKRACASVLDGFEDVCGKWRKRLCEGLGVASA